MSVFHFPFPSDAFLLNRPMSLSFFRRLHLSSSFWYSTILYNTVLSVSFLLWKCYHHFRSRILRMTRKKNNVLKSRCVWGRRILEDPFVTVTDSLSFLHCLLWRHGTIDTDYRRISGENDGKMRRREKKKAKLGIWNFCLFCLRRQSEKRTVNSSKGFPLYWRGWNAFSSFPPKFSVLFCSSSHQVKFFLSASSYPFHYTTTRYWRKWNEIDIEFRWYKGAGMRSRVPSISIFPFRIL